jgi:lysophospholipase L1-like esterase
MNRHAFITALLVSILEANPTFAQPLGGGSGAAADPDQETLPVAHPRAALDWSIAPRFEAGWAAYDPATGLYDDGYVHPRFVDVGFDACRSRGGSAPIKEIRVLIRSSPDGPIGSELVMRDGTCRAETSMAILPQVAEVRVTNADGEQAAASVKLPLRDWLIVSLGDSLSSGEGVPDRDAEVRSFRLPTTGLITAPDCREVDDGNFDLNESFLIYNTVVGNESEWELELNRPADWVDRRCHRSKLSGPALAAKAIEERDPHSSVTFISLACSGATLRSGVLGRYDGQEIPEGNTPEIGAQIDVLRRLVGDRPVDALLLSVGINDIGFSDILFSAATEHPSTFKDSGPRRFDEGFVELPSRFRELSDRLQLGMSVAEVYTILYPQTPFSGAGEKRQSCNVFEDRLIGNMGVQEREIRVIESLGERLNAGILEVSRQMNWNPVDARKVFRGAGYCAPASRRKLVRLNESCRTIGRRDGTMHPNRAGHQMIAERLMEAIVLGPVPRPSHRVTVRIQSIAVADPLPLPGDPAVPIFLEFGRGLGAAPDFRQLIARRNATTSVPLELGRFSFRVWPAPTLPRLTTGAALNITGQLPALQIDDPEPPQGGQNPPPRPPRRFSTTINMLAQNGFAGTDGLETRTADFANGGRVAISYEVDVARIPVIDEDLEVPDTPPVKPVP